MGCCTSYPHASKPIRTNMSRRPQDHLEEETKNPEYYRKHSEVVELDVGHPEPVKNQVFVPNMVEQRKNLEASLPRSDHEFNLNKDLLESLRSGITLRKETASQDMEVSTYKITREQHDMILRLVNEVSAIIDADLARLHDYLVYFYYEYDELPVSIEQLRNNNKDLENCLDDLKAHPIPNEPTFYYLSERRCRLIKNIVWEYSRFKQGNGDYTAFKGIALDLIRKYNTNAPDDRLDNNFAKPQREIKSDDIVRTKETAMTSQRGLPVTDRTELPPYGFQQGNWSQSEVSGEPVCETTDRGFEKKNSIEKWQIDKNLESSTIFKKDKSESEEVHKKVELPLIDFPSIDTLHNAQQVYKEQKESMVDVFPRRVKNHRRGSKEVEYARKETSHNGSNNNGQNDLENIDVYLKEEESLKKIEVKENGSDKKAKVSGHLAMVMKLRKINQQRRDEMSYGLKTEEEYSERPEI